VQSIILHVEGVITIVVTIVTLVVAYWHYFRGDKLKPDCIFCGRDEHWSVDCPAAGARER
jgi:hypothetical protein